MYAVTYSMKQVVEMNDTILNNEYTVELSALKSDSTIVSIFTTGAHTSSWCMHALFDYIWSFHISTLYQISSNY